MTKCSRTALSSLLDTMVIDTLVDAVRSIERLKVGIRVTMIDRWITHRLPSLVVWSIRGRRTVLGCRFRLSRLYPRVVSKERRSNIIR